MKRTNLFAASAALFALLTGAAVAQDASASFNDIDTSGDDFIDYAEAEAVFGAGGADNLFRNDADGDNLLSLDELIDGGNAVDEDGNAVGGADSDADYKDADRGHGNDPDGFDEDNPGKGHDSDNGERGGGNGGGNGGGRGN